MIRLDGRLGVWQVIEVYTTRPAGDVLARERDYTRQRDASDIERGKRGTP